MPTKRLTDKAQRPNSAATSPRTVPPQALDTIKQSETNEVKALAKPPMGVKVVCEAVCVMLGIKPVRIPDPEDPSKRIMDFWGPSQKMLGEADFIAQLKG